MRHDQNALAGDKPTSSMSWVTNSTVTRSLCHNTRNDIFEIGASLRIDRGEWLVHQQNMRFIGDGAGNRDALLHAAGELPRIGAVHIGEIDGSERIAHQDLRAAPPSSSSASAAAPRF